MNLFMKMLGQVFYREFLGVFLVLQFQDEIEIIFKYKDIISINDRV